MSTKIIDAGIAWSHSDLITLAVWLALKSDGPLTAFFEGNIYRADNYAPQLAGAPWRLVVAAIDRTEEGAISSRLAGVHKVGIIIEYQSKARYLDESEPSVDSVLTHIQTILEAHVGLPMSDWPGVAAFNGGAANLTIGSGNHPSGTAWGRIQFNPIPIEGKDNAVAYFVGVTVNFAYKSNFPSRTVPGRPT